MKKPNAKRTVPRPSPSRRAAARSSDDRSALSHPSRAKANENASEREPYDEFHFSNAVALALANAGVELPETCDPQDPLASLDYGVECAAKLEAIRSFWRARRLPAPLLKTLIPSPEPRACRTSSKRRIHIASGGLVKMTTGYRGERAETVVSPMETPLHGEIYAFLRKILAKPAYAPLARNLNYVVLRGSSRSCSLILNFFHMDAAVMRKVKLLSELLRKEEPRVVSFETLLDETRSEYYLDSRFDRRTLRRHFGPECLDVTVGGLKYFYPPVAFSQVNESMLVPFVAEIEKLVAPTPASTVYDLYCGYGLFGIRMAKAARRVIGVDVNEPAVRAAIGNAEHLAQGADVRFQTASVSAAWLENLPPPDGKELFILDPPRGGTSNGVIRAIAERKPARVVHIFCSVDQQPQELRIWQGCGYFPTAVRVFDMFPGSANLETAVLLERREIRRSGTSAPGTSAGIAKRRTASKPVRSGKRSGGRRGFRPSNDGEAPSARRVRRRSEPISHKNDAIAEQRSASRANAKRKSASSGARGSQRGTSPRATDMKRSSGRKPRSPHRADADSKRTSRTPKSPNSASAVRGQGRGRRAGG